MCLVVSIQATALCACDNATGNQNANANRNLLNVSANANQNVNANKSSDALLREEVREKDDAAKSKAVQEFIAREYPGWELYGVSSEFLEGCEENEACHLDLVKGKTHKIITVVLRRYFRPDGTNYFLLSEARATDLARWRKERIRQAVIDDLSVDDVSDSLREAIIDDYRSELAEAAWEPEHEGPY